VYDHGRHAAGNHGSFKEYFEEVRHFVEHFRRQHGDHAHAYGSGDDNTFAAGHAVLVVPGPSAAIAALVASGLPTGRFVFEGFLPRKGSARDQRLAELAAERRTVVCYEAPHRLARTLVDLRDAFGASRRVAVARELTKLHEEIWRGTLDDACAWASASEPRGEIVLVLDGAPDAPPASEDVLRDELREHLARGMSTKDAAYAVALAHGASRRAVYELALTLPRAPR
jgi:16S rRNA (cytidine1402-2'-O)-methyltransferase